jgi:hypothetical protein
LRFRHAIGARRLSSGNARIRIDDAPRPYEFHVHDVRRYGASLTDGAVASVRVSGVADGVAANGAVTVEQLNQMKNEFNRIGASIDS